VRDVTWAGGWDDLQTALVSQNATRIPRGRLSSTRNSNRRDHRAPSSVAASDVTTVAIRRFDAGKSVGLYLGVGFVVFVVGCGSGNAKYVC
jgi:hypothetical protein